MRKLTKKDFLNNKTRFIEDGNRAMDLGEFEEYVKESAKLHTNIIGLKSISQLRKRVKDARLEIMSVHDLLLSMPEKIIHFVPSAEWIVDNYYLIEREAKLFEQREKDAKLSLPLLGEGELAGYPRVFALARDIMKSAGYHLDEDIISDMLKVYQKITPLSVSELWALFDMIRATLIISLNFICKDILELIEIKFKADRIMDEILDNGRNDGDYQLPFDKYLKKEDLIKPAFLTHIMYRLKETAVDEDVLNVWIAGKFDKDIDLYNTICVEGQNQAKLQVTAGALVTSLREQAGLDFERLFEKISPVEDVFNDDPSEFYSKMDFETRMDYHKKVQKLSKELNTDEVNIAKEAINLSLKSSKKKAEIKKSHVGYYILGKGCKDLKESFGVRSSQVSNTLKSVGFWYFASIITSSLIIISLSSLYTFRRVQSLGLGLLTILLMIIPAITMSVEVVNFITGRFIKPNKLPSMDFIDGIPEEYTSIVVMPVLLGSIEQVKKYIQRFETYYFANKDKNLYFALLGDLRDADKRELEDDKEIIDFAVKEIKKLNDKYSSNEIRFGFFNRERLWNEKQNCWMGRERKRGMLEELNALISGEDRKAFTTVIINKQILKKVKFVITIDAGTELIRDSAKSLIGLMAHPLNMPIANKKKGIVEDGYTIIQPRVGIRVSSAFSTAFAKIFSGQAGIDTYTPVVSDIYQDVFGRGTFAGKGIYDPRVFHATISTQFPENAILSHDLLEGCYVQCATATNVQFMDDFPSSLVSFFMREHRWIRGDWQLLPWLIGKNKLSGLSKYKMADNLRRSVIPINYLLLIFLSVSILSWNFWVWGTIVLFTTLFPLVIHASRTTVIGFDRYGSGFNILNHIRSILLTFFQGLVWFAILPYRAYIAGDAIVRTLYRLYISKKKMLEWKTAEAVERSLTNSLSSYFRRMWFTPLCAVLLIAISGKDHFVSTVVVAILWLVAPFIGYLLGRIIKNKKVSLDKNKVQSLRLISRKTWGYFDEFFTKDDNWLIPDNYQVWPQNGIAHRTSTTNIGLQLICILSARDFGYIGILSLIDRLSKVFESLSKLERWNGHFYNWYDTRSLHPLMPKYVSTVDSGNFIGCMIALKNGLFEMKNIPVLNSKIIDGIKDTARLAQIETEFEEIDLKDIGSWKSMLEKVKDKAKSDDSSSMWSEKLEKMCELILEDIDKLELKWDSTLLKASEYNENAQMALDKIDEIIKSIDEIIISTNFRPLYDKRRNQFRIGHNVSSGIDDKSYYDLLASEARLASFIAIAKDDVPMKHWFKLGRMLTLIKGRPTLVSWSGTMFEYLMPNILMKFVRSTLLEQTAIGAVRLQINYALKRSVPWGMSEAAYYRFDQHLNYQYRAIGVPDLGFSNDLGKFLVIAPYATMLAIGIEPNAAFENLELMKKLGAEGDYGFYEAIDYVSPDANNYNKFNIVKSFFAHHQGMSLVSLNNYINKDVMRNRFHVEPLIRSAEIILEEKQPSYVVIRDTQKDITRQDVSRRMKKQTVSRVVKYTKTAYPTAHVLSNGRYSVMIASTGAGYSWNNDTVVNRWRPDPTCDNYGQFIYIRDICSLKYWSAAYQPSGNEPDAYQANFYLDKVHFSRIDGQICTDTQITVSPDDNVEIRYVTLTNNGSDEVKLEVTSYMEAVIDKFNNDLAHPAFSKLFVETEYLEDKHTLIAARRPREKENERKFLFHTVLVDDRPAKEIEYETDRSKFIGRCNDVSNPSALTKELHLSNSIGRVLDTIMSVRVTLEIPPGKSRTVTYITGVSNSRIDCIKLVHEYRKPHVVVDTFKMALINSEVEMKYLDITPQQANAVQDIVGSIYYPSQLMRASEDILKNNIKGQSGLWRFGISGDHPIVLLRVNDISDLDTVKDVILAYEYLKLKKVKLDLVILNEQQEGYFQDLSQKIRDLIFGIKIYDVDEKSSGAFLLNSVSMEKEEITLLLTVARIVLTGGNRLLSKRVRSIMLKEKSDNDLNLMSDKDNEYVDNLLQPEELNLFNGIGGFAKDGREYIITLKEGQNTPAPWINIISNQVFGTNVSESGSGYTWSLNSRENKITKWSNDQISDPPAEVIYIRDENTGEYFCPTALPIREKNDYRIRHGFGYSIFEHNSHGIEQNMTIFVAQNDPVKIYKLKLKNTSNEVRKLSLTYYAELVLGVAREQCTPYVVTDYNTDHEVFTAVNKYNSDFSNVVAFVFSNEKISSFSGDRSDFVGKGKCLETPQAMGVKSLSSKVGAGADPCASLRIEIELNSEQSKDIVFVLGQTDNIDKIYAFANKYRNIDYIKNELEEVKKNWINLLSTIKVSTTDNTFNNLLNGWLLYQTISSRLLARGGFYQAGGAFGFRDQLQDSMALLYASPDTTRQKILLHSSRQFIEGDVQHWWHPELGRGVRTKISDDLLWLPYVTSKYIEVTGDESILDEMSAFLEDRELGPEDHDRFTIPKVSNASESIYEHCIRAIERSLKFGEHGLPLMGTGDWNDGMDRVGVKGKGESVWLSWLIYDVLNRFESICRMKNEVERAERYLEIAQMLRKNIEENAWDGEWYLRAYFDDGTPLGSIKNVECQIDSISQAWGVISSGASQDRAKMAMEAVRKHLVKENDQIIQLLAPPFDKSETNPGYIKGYIPGIRENGGQYTHGAVWTVIAYAKLGLGDTAYRLFSMLNPINHTLTYTEILKYKNEPYVMSADVYSTPPHNGRGGWSWYTGAAGWMYQAGIEWILGIKKRGETLQVDPAIPKEWENYSINYRYKESYYNITVDNPNGICKGVNKVVVDDNNCEDKIIHLIDDGKEHKVNVVMG